MTPHRLIGLCGALAERFDVNTILSVDTFAVPDINKIDREQVSVYFVCHTKKAKHLAEGFLPLAEKLIQMSCGFGDTIDFNHDTWNCSTAVAARLWTHENYNYLPRFSTVSSSDIPAVSAAACFLFRPCDVFYPDADASKYSLRKDVPHSVLFGMAIRLFQLYRHVHTFPLFACVNVSMLPEPLPLFKAHASHLVTPYRFQHFFQVFLLFFFGVLLFTGGHL